MRLGLAAQDRPDIGGKGDKGQEQRDAAQPFFGKKEIVHAKWCINYTEQSTDKRKMVRLIILDRLAQPLDIGQKTCGSHFADNLEHP